MPLTSPYVGQRLCLATHHGKQRALALPFALGLGATLEVCDCDTDSLGTFSGEVQRLDDALSTCRSKAWIGLEHSSLGLGMASEASFGPHHAVPMLAVGQELLVFIDRARELTVVEQRIGWRTNYAQKRLTPGEDPTPWLKQVGFPSHGVIARPSERADGPFFKDLTDLVVLQEALAACRRLDSQGQVWLETDMRAHRNPTRMRSIRRLGVALVRRLCAPCPGCGSPGWGVIDRQAGLPCRCCGTPTDLLAVEMWGCPSCPLQVPRARRDGLEAADPGFCPWCNP